jgi:hypothetical protein
MARGYEAPSDSELYEILLDMGYTNKEITGGSHQAKDDLQMAGEMRQRAVNKFKQKWREENQGGDVEISVDDLWR